MNLQNIMRTEDVIDGRAGSAYLIDGEKRLLLFHLKKWESKTDLEKTDVPRLGVTVPGYRYNGTKNTFTADMYYVSDVFRQKVIEYMKTGKQFTFDIQITNDDTNSAAGRHTIIHRNCMLDSVILAKLDITTTALEESISGTFERVDMPEAFKELEGMRA